ncbi:MAG: ribonuclease R [Lachnospiraceae bacterium]|nr:ribonuclease R [Lachnospiraceae bacterium]
MISETQNRKNLILKLMSEPKYVPMKEKELAVFLQVKKEDRDDLKEILDSLLFEQKMMVSMRGKYSLYKEKKLTGIYRSTMHGFGFVETEDENDDYYIPEGMSLNAMYGDTVEISVLKKRRGKRREAEIVKILERATDTVVGTYERGKNHYGFVVPDNAKLSRDIFIPVERSKGAMDGHKVVCEITDYGTESRSPEGKIIEILGHITDPGVDILSVIKGYNLQLEFPEKVMHMAERIPEEIQEAEMAGRLDLRDVMMVTIDGEDSKDLDDAVSLEMDGENYRLGVHIADVSNYVKENSALDKEALKRGCSVYLVDRVIPMLPRRLSNGICSLNESVDRLTLSCIMTIDKKGHVIDHKIAESIIKTNRRMTYTAVNAILEENDPELFREYEEIVPMFFLMKELAAILRDKRKKRGSIDFDLDETKILLDEKGHPTYVGPYERNTATRLIEEFMLIANETVAEHFYWLKLPFAYRIHEAPDIEKVRKLSSFIRNFGYGLHIKGDEVHPKELQKLLAKCEGTAEEELISRLTLRSMQRAKYSPECLGHYGLACDYYCHFTSPIRRYPDLQIHRIIKESLHMRLKDERIAHYEKILPDVCKSSSACERTADEAEREVDKLKKAEYMLDKIGEVYSGMISGITNWGIYVELDNTVEGLVHISKIAGDYYVFNEDSYELVGEATGKKYVLGQRVNIRVNAVDMMLRSVDFLLEE